MLVACTFFAYEGVRLFTAHQQCIAVHAQNDMLIHNAMCSDPHERRLHGKKQDEACTKAEEENLVWPSWCALQRMWVDGEARRVWAMVTESHWMLFGLGAVLIACTTWGATSACRGGPSRRHDDDDDYDDIRRHRHHMIDRPMRQQVRYIEPPQHDDDEYITLINPHRRRKQLTYI